MNLRRNLAHQFSLRALFTFTAVAAIDFGLLTRWRDVPSTMSAIGLAQLILLLVCIGYYWLVRTQPPSDPQYAYRTLFNGILASGVCYGGTLLCFSPTPLTFRDVPVVCILIVVAGGIVTWFSSGILYVVAFGGFDEKLRSLSFTRQAAIFGAAVGLIGPTAGAFLCTGGQIGNGLGWSWIGLGIALPGVLFAAVTSLFATHLDQPD